MLMNMVITSGVSESVGATITVQIYGAARETITFTGPGGTASVVLDVSGYGTISIASGYYLITGNGDSLTLYPAGITMKLTATNNTVYLRPQSTAFWYGLTELEGGFVAYDQKTYSSNIVHPTGDAASGYSIIIHSGSVSLYWARAVPKNPLSILKSDGTKYSTCKMLVTGYTKWGDVWVGSNYTQARARSSFGIIETGAQIDVNSSSKKTIISFDISGVTGDTILPYIRTEECHDPNENWSPKATVYAIWFE